MQIMSWNAELGRGCRDIKRYTGLAICVSPQGFGWVDPRPTLTSTKTWVFAPHETVARQARYLVNLPCPPPLTAKPNIAGS